MGKIGGEFLAWKRLHFQQCVLSASQVLYLTEAFDCIIILTCIVSFILCTRSVLTGIRLQCVSDPILMLIIMGLGGQKQKARVQTSAVTSSPKQQERG